MTEEIKPPPEVIKFVRDLAKAQPVVDGGFLGLTIKIQFPQLDVRGSFGNLAEMIRRHFSDVFELITAPGGNMILRSLVSSASQPYPDNQRLWSSFVGPTSAFRPYISMDNMSVYCDDTPHSTQDLEIVPMSKQDHLTIAEAFMSQLGSDPELQEGTDQSVCNGLRSALKEADYWPEWSKQVRRSKALGSRWATFRLGAIRSLLRDRIVTVAPSFPDTEAFVASLSPNSNSLIADGKLSVAKSSLDNNTDIWLRKRVVAAIYNMNPEDLRRVWLPVGAMFPYKSKN